MFPHGRPVGGQASRIAELLEHLKRECEAVGEESTIYRNQRDECERKLEAQIGELQHIQANLVALDQAFQQSKKQYEEQIMILRRENEALRAGRPPPSVQDFPPASGSGVAMVGSSNNAGPGPARPTGPEGPMGIMRPNNGLLEKLTMPGQPRPGEPGPGPGLPMPAGMLQHPGGPLPPPPGAPGGYYPPGSLPPPPIPGPGPGSDAGAAGKRGAYPVPPLDKGGPPLKRRPEGEGSGKDGRKDEGPIPSMRDAPDNGPGSPQMRARAHRGRGADLDGTRRDSDFPPDGASASGRPSEDRKDASPVIRDGPDAPPPTDQPGVMKKEGNDWFIVVNPSVQVQNLNLDLMHSVEHGSVVCCVSFSQDGRLLATGCNNTAQIYDVESGKEVAVFYDEGRDGENGAPPAEGKEDSYVRAVCFSPDNRFLAAGAEDRIVKVWDIENRRLRYAFTGHELDIYSLDFSRDGRFLVSGSGDCRAKLWDIANAKCLYTLGTDESGPKDGVTSVAISPDGRLVAAGSLDRIVRLWDATTGQCVERFEGHSDSVYSVAFSPDGRSLASGSLDKSLKLWDLTSSGMRSGGRPKCRTTFVGHKDFVLSVAFSPDGSYLVSGSKDRSVQFWDPRSGVTHFMLQGHKNSVISVAMSPNGGGVFATGSGDFRARVWKYDVRNVAAAPIRK
eukprot:tig00020952_g16506.t1